MLAGAPAQQIEGLSPPSERGGRPRAGKIDGRVLELDRSVASEQRFGLRPLLFELQIARDFDELPLALADPVRRAGEERLEGCGRLRIAADPNSDFNELCRTIGIPGRERVVLFEVSERPLQISDVLVGNPAIPVRLAELVSAQLT